MRTCSNCHANCTPDAAFCDECGVRFAEEPTSRGADSLRSACPVCGAPGQPDVKYCEECGAASPAAAGPHEAPQRAGRTKEVSRAVDAKRAAPVTLATTARSDALSTAARAIALGRAATPDRVGLRMESRPPVSRGATKSSTSGATGPSSRSSPGSNDALATHRPLAGAPLFLVPRSLLAGAGRGQLERILAQACPEAGYLAVDAEEALDAAQEAIRHAAESETLPDAVCLLGSPTRLPHAALEDGTGHDEACLTDNLYGSPYTANDDERAAGDLLPWVPVSRVPLDELDAIEALFARGPTLADSWRGGLMVSCEVWEGASRAVAETLCGQGLVHLSPPTAEADIAGHLGHEPARLYFNVHGTDQAAVWVGEGARALNPVVLRPELVRVAPRAVVVSEACYGAAIFEGEEAISTAFLAAGASAFFGSTIIAWGPPMAPPGLADLIVVGVYGGLDSGLPAGAALLEAKRAILDAYLERDGGLVSAAQNTLLSFCHYGLPWARSTAPKGFHRPKMRVTAPGQDRVKATTGSVDRLTERIRSGRGSSTQHGGVTSRVRSELAHKAESQGWAVDFVQQGPLVELAASLGDQREVLQSLGLEENAPVGTGVLRRYRSKIGHRLEVVIRGSTTTVFDEAGNVLEQAHRKGAR